MLSRAVELGLNADGTFVAINNKISQSVPHLHVHVVPIRLSGPEEASEAVPAPPGNDVDVEVGDALADAVVDGDERAVRVQARFDRAGQSLDVREQVAD